MKMRDTELYRTNVRVFNSILQRYLGVLTEKGNTKVSAYNKGENVNVLANMLNVFTLMDEMKTFGEKDYDDKLMPKLAEFTQKTRKLSNKMDKAETEKIFSEMARNPEKRDQVINQNVIREAYESYYKKPSNLAQHPELKEQMEKTNTVGKFDSFLQKLKDSRTKRNSDEYEKIIKAVDLVNRTDEFKKGKNLTEEQRYAVKLLAIKNSINDYIEHKAKHGVNKNIGDKLEAVEALNKEVSQRLSELKLDPFDFNGKRVDFSNYAVTIEQERRAALKANPKGKLPEEKSINDLTDVCMNRIITKAVEKKCFNSHINSLKKMQAQLWERDTPQLQTTDEVICL